MPPFPFMSSKSNASSARSVSRRLVFALLLTASLCACKPSGPGNAPAAAQQKDSPRGAESDMQADAGTSRASRSPGDDTEQRAAQSVSKEGSQRTVVVSKKTGGRRATVVISGDITVSGDIVRSSGRSGCIVIRGGKSSRGEEARRAAAEARKRIAKARKRVAKAQKRIAEILSEASEEASRSQKDRQPRSRYRPAQLAYTRDLLEGESRSRVSKWTEALRVYVQGNATQRSRNALHEALQAASSRTGIGFSYVGERHLANVVVRFTTLAVVRSQCDGCIGWSDLEWSNRPGSIRRGELLVGYAREIGQPSATATVYHEVGHLFGLGHAREESPSIMTPVAPLDQGFSKGDLRSLEMLYRPEIKPGMTVGEAIGALR